MDLRLDPQTGDLAVSSGDVPLVTGAEAVAQQLRIRLRMSRGEWAFDTRVGIPYYQEILGKPASLDAVRALLRRAVNTCPGVASVERFDLYYDAPRRLRLDCAVTTTDGDPVAFTEFLG